MSAVLEISTATHAAIIRDAYHTGKRDGIAEARAKESCLPAIAPDVVRKLLHIAGELSKAGAAAEMDGYPHAAEFLREYSGRVADQAFRLDLAVGLEAGK